MRGNKYYAVYDSNDNIVFVAEDYDELIKFFPSHERRKLQYSVTKKHGIRENGKSYRVYTMYTQGGRK